MTATQKTLSDTEDSIIRIKAGRVGQLMDMVGELSLAADEVIHHPQLVNLELDALQNSAHKLHQLIRELQDLASSLRLVPIDSVFRRMQRLARDLSKQTGKKFKFEIHGEDTELDKVVVDTLSDPLVHLIRNSVDHGLETNQERLEKGKPEQGRVLLAARQEGGEIYITIEDDGNGLDKDKIMKRAIEKGLIKKTDNLSDEQIFSLIFEPGFSTKEAVSQLSGRGVGMDVVKTTISYLRGRINISSKPGFGTKLELVIPLSVAFLNTMVIQEKNKLFAIAIENILEVVRRTEVEIAKSSANNQECIKVRGQLVPILSLGSVHQELKSSTIEESHHILAVVNTLNGKFALPVESIIGQYQVTIKQLTGYLKDIRAVSGCALLPSGEVAWVLDTGKLGEHISGTENNASEIA